MSRPTLDDLRRVAKVGKGICDGVWRRLRWPRPFGPDAPQGCILCGTLECVALCASVDDWCPVVVGMVVDGDSVVVSLGAPKFCASCLRAALAELEP